MSVNKNCYVYELVSVFDRKTNMNEFGLLSTTIDYSGIEAFVGDSDIELSVDNEMVMILKNVNSTILNQLKNGAKFKIINVDKNEVKPVSIRN